MISKASVINTDFKHRIFASSVVVNTFSYRNFPISLFPTFIPEEATYINAETLRL